MEKAPFLLSGQERLEFLGTRKSGNYHFSRNMGLPWNLVLWRGKGEEKNT